MIGSGDIFHNSYLAWPGQLISEIALKNVLLVGDPSQELVKKALESGLEVRHSEPSRVNGLPLGTTIFRIKGAWHLVVSSVGKIREDTSPHERQQFIENDSDPLIYLIERFSGLWEEASSIGETAKFSLGTSVQLLADRTVGKVERVQIISGQALYSVLTNRGITQVREIDLQELQSLQGDPSTWLNAPMSDAENIALTLTATKLRDPLTDVIYSFQTSRTLFRPYQFKPVLKMLMGTKQRILIADEVGLGKTIEAGLIWSELDLRTPMENVLVVCPAALKKKWQDEMYRRFDRKLEELNNERLGSWLDQIELGRSEPLKAIASLEGLRTSVHLERLSKLAPRFDLIIVDEAHYLRNSHTQSFALGEVISDIADALVFLSATPLNLGNNDLFNLLNLLDSSQFFDRSVFDDQLEPNKYLNEIARNLLNSNLNPRDLLPYLKAIKGTALGHTIVNRSDFESLEDLLSLESLSTNQISRAKRHIAELNTLASVFTRTRKAETPEKRAIRTPISVQVNWTDEEHDAYAFIRKWFTDRALAKGISPGLALQMPLRQAASCLPATFELLQDKYGFAQEEFEGLDAYDGHDSAESVIKLMDIDFNIIPTIPRDTKYLEFEKALLSARKNGTAKQVLVFSFFTRTIKYLQRELSKTGLNVKTMYGATPPKERQDLMASFRRAEFDILICSEVGSEGLDFEFCDTLVNYDVPWNPMKVEQRIGRLDRFGQKADKIFIFNMQIPGTIEDDIFMRLYSRIGVFEESIGELEPILRDELISLTELALNPNLSESEREREVHRINVAVKSKKGHLEDLTAHQNLIGGVDAFLIEGFDEHTPGRGRFLGSQEIVRVVDRYLTKKSGSLKDLGDERWLITGSKEISTDLRLMASNPSFFGKNGNVSMSPANLARELDGTGSGLVVTFSPELAANFNVELISVRHPLLECVKQDLVVSESLLNRFGSISLKEIPVGAEYLIGVHLARAHGIRPRLELWSTSVDLATGNLIDGPGDALLQSLAANTFGKAETSPSNAILMRALEKIEFDVAKRQLRENDILVRDNDAIASERASAKRLSLENKISSAQGTLSKVIAANRAPGIIRLNESRLNRLVGELENLDRSFSSKHASLAIEAIAYVVARGD
ncbi:SF2_C_SNF domain containing protein [Candidatus Nanopelagicaceae bacterium]